VGQNAGMKEDKEEKRKRDVKLNRRIAINPLKTTRLNTENFSIETT
jgi:hypothetical protein